MKLKDLQKNWDELAKKNPLWAVLTYRKEWSVTEFFKTGVGEIDGVMEYMTTLGINIPRSKALDFGCGVGRLTQALANHFDESYGVDISPTMIEKAIEYDSKSKCKFSLNESDDLKLFNDDSIDFIYSNITLMHMEPKYSKKYIKEFLRISNSGGIIVFSLPTQSINKLKVKIIRLLTPLLKLKGPLMEMHVIGEEELKNLIDENNGKVLATQRKKEGGYIFVTYYIKAN